MSDQVRAALVFAGEDKDQITPDDVLAAIRRLLVAERESRRLRVVDLSFDCEHLASI